MDSNVFSKKDIINNLSSKGCFVDAYTLDAFLKKNKIEAIFEDAKGNEFFDQNALDTVIKELTGKKQQDDFDPDMDVMATLDLINKMSLPDAIPIDNNTDSLKMFYGSTETEKNEQKTAPDALGGKSQDNPPSNVEENSANDMDINADFEDFDDTTLLNESYEAQEKFRQYVMSELAKNNPDFSSQMQAANQIGNELKFNISEKTLNMIAKTMAKKIAKYVCSIISQDLKQNAKTAEFEEEKKQLTKKIRELEDLNRKLRLLLAESNKNLNSYQPSVFGLYKKVIKKGKK